MDITTKTSNMSIEDSTPSPSEGSIKTLSQRERRRNLEILKYGRSLRSILQLEDIERPLMTEPDKSSPRLALDAALTSFAQLATLRMGAKRGFLCLADGAEQHIIAEATRTISLFDSSKHAPDDGLLFGVQSIPHEYGVSSLTLPAYRGDREWWIESKATIINDVKCVLTDLRAEPHVQHLPFIKHNTSHRVYIEVPIRNLKGIIVGIVGVLDDQPRSDAAAIDVQPLYDVSRVVAEHLELVRLKDVTMRAERLMQALGHFNKGKSSISQWTMDNPDQALATDKQNHINQLRGRDLTMASIQEFTGRDTSRSRNAASRSETSLSAQPRDYFENVIDASSTSAATTPAASTDRSMNPTMTSGTSNDTSTTVTSDTVRRTVSQQQQLPEDSKTPVERPAKTVITNIQAVFSRASNLLRESMDLEAACFLDISADGRFNFTKRRPSKSSQGQIQSDKDTAAFTSSDGLLSSASGSEGDPMGMTQAAQSRLERMLCNRIAYSTRKQSSISGITIAESSMTMPETALKRLVTVYPTGHIFNFDAHGAISSGDDSSNDIQQISQRRKLATAVNTAFSGATSVVFIPLYDNERRHLYSAFFGWIEDPFRVILNDEAIYISGFANSIMCEVMRLEALALEKAKSDFMSSISHELRSPLHGILAATQLMQETRLSPSQSELALMVDDCGRSLLDIMNNLLEHAKINNLVDKASRAKRSKKRRLRRKEMNNDTIVDVPNEAAVSAPLVDIATVVEETVASVAAGYLFKEHQIEQHPARKVLRSQTAKTLQSDQDTSDKAAAGPLMVVDIQYRADWFFEIDAGTWRRIVMNLVGNAMKYTRKGYVKVALHTKIGPNGSDNTLAESIVLTVLDTGQGISESYMKHRLYTPFSQENNLSVGVGLGLSIVDRLVAGMGGKIHVESEVDVGTRIMVTLPLRRQIVRPALSRQPSHTISDAVTRSARVGSKVCFVGFEIYPDLTSEPTGTMSPHAQSLMQLKQALTTLISTWFALRTTTNIEEATMYIIEKSHAVSIMTSDPDNIIFDRKYILINTFDESTARGLNWRGCYTKLSAPVGPRKLARALTTVFQQEIETSSSLPVRPPLPCMDSARTVTPVPFEREKLDLTRQSSSETLNVGSSEKCKIMLVEDNNINLRILAQLVRKLKFPFVTASNGLEALDRYKASHENGDPINFIFMDISMPVMDGLTSTRNIRAYEAENRMAKPAEIVALTGLGHEETQKEAIASGVDQYHRKPVGLNTLRELLRSYHPRA